MASSAWRDSGLKRKLSTCSSTSSAAEFLRIDSGYNARDNSDSDSVTMGGLLRSSFVDRDLGPDQGQRRQVTGMERNPGALLSSEISLLDAIGAVAPANECEMERPRKRNCGAYGECDSCCGEAKTASLAQIRFHTVVIFSVEGEIEMINA